MQQTSTMNEPRRGRPPVTSRRELEVIALRLFTEHGFDETTIDHIAAAAGVSRRTFFRYFKSKAGVLWAEFDHEVDTIRAALAGMPDDMPMMDAIRNAVVAANHYRAEDVPELRTRMNLIGAVPDLHASAAVHYDAWERAISDFVAKRIRQPAETCTRSRSAGPRSPRAGPPMTAGSCAPTPTSPSTWTRRCARSPPDSRRRCCAGRPRVCPAQRAEGAARSGQATRIRVGACATVSPITGAPGISPMTSSPPLVCASASSSNSSSSTRRCARCGRTQSRFRRVPPADVARRAMPRARRRGRERLPSR